MAWAAAAVTLCAITVMGQDSQSISRLAWLAGSWKHETARMAFEEKWVKLSDTLFRGESTTVSLPDRKTIASESLILADMGGEIFYIARPSQNPLPVAFKLVRADDGSATFENPKHDFPTRITYTRNPDGSLDARVEGVENGKQRAIRFHFVRTGDAPRP
jgi:hypothetical protein